MADITVLAQMLEPCAVVAVASDHAVTLREVAVQADGTTNIVSEAVIRKLPPVCLVIRADRFPAPEALLRADHGQRRRCDFIILAETPSGTKAIFVEMKKSAPATRQEVVEQLRGGICVLEYLRAVAREFWDSNSDSEPISFRFVSLCYAAARRRRPEVKRSSQPHDRPEHYLRLDDTRTVQFDVLAE